jgi:RimJ/RimL family protein N-acetyltransferase
MFSDPIEMQYLTSMSKADCGGWTVEDAKHRRLDQIEKQRQGICWNCVATLKSGEFIGVCGLRSIDHWNKSGEMGIILKRDYWGQGYSAEIHFWLLQHAFESLGLNRITFLTASRNTPMIQFCRKVLRATHEGTLRDFFPLGNQDYESVELYSLLRRDWTGARESLLTRLHI